MYKQMMYQYQPGYSWFHKLNPLPKFVWLICMSVLAIRYEDAGAQLLLMGVTLLFGFVACKLTLPEIWRRIWIPLLFSLPYFLLQLLFVPGETELWQLGKLVITAEAFDFALAITL